MALALMPAIVFAQPRGAMPRGGPGWADPSDVIAAEIAFARLARDKGQWTAFRQTAAPGAQMFAPQPVRTADYLKGKRDPQQSVNWQPHSVWMACDGSFAVTRGAWQGPKATGYFITVWQRQRKGGYKWVLDQGDALATPIAAPDFLTAKVAECVSRGHGDHDDRDSRDDKSAVPPTQIDWLSGHSPDGTLAWTTTVAADGARHFALTVRGDGALHEVTRSDVRADVAPGG